MNSEYNQYLSGDSQYQVNFLGDVRMDQLLFNRTIVIKTTDKVKIYELSPAIPS
jgi:hypothetical protein